MRVLLSEEKQGRENGTGFSERFLYSFCYFLLQYAGTVYLFIFHKNHQL